MPGLDKPMNGGRRTADGGRPPKILVIRFSSIGDIVLTTPVVRCLKQQLGAEVHFLTKQAFTQVVEPNPYIDRVWAFSKDLSEVLPALKQEGFDWIIDLHHNLRSRIVRFSLGRPSRAFNKLNLEKWMLVHTGFNMLPKVHIVLRYMDTVRDLGVVYDGKGLDYFIPEDQEVDIVSLSPGLAPGEYIAFVLGATHATKRLPIEQMEAIVRQAPGPVVLLGGKAEAGMGKALAGVAPGIIDCCGQLSLHQSASVVRQAGMVLTHDTGLMHVAAAFHKQIVSVWGNTVPAFGMYPFYPDGMNLNTTIEVNGLSCRPCSKIGYAQCPKGHFKCMREIDPNWIIANLGK
jgi:ADP-heptose:LPS heptosyltransferase